MDQNEILKYVEPILRFCQKRLSNRHDAEDLASEIIEHILSGMKKYEIQSLDAWVWRVAHNRYARLIDAQHKSITILSGDEYMFDITDSDETQAESEEIDEYQTVFRYLHTLASEYKNIFVDYYLGEKSIRELSAKYSLPETTVKWRLNVSRQRIRNRIGDNIMEQIYKRINWNTGTCNGSMDSDRYLHSQLARAICLAAYEKPLSVEEISMVTGIPTMYIEDELPRLEFGDAIRRIGSKYATDFIILNLEQRSRLESISANTVDSLADFFERRFSEEADAVAALDFYGNNFEMKRLGHIAVPYILRNLIRIIKSRLRFEDGAFPIRKDGGYGWFIVEETADERENISEYASGCNVAGDDSGSACSEGGQIYYYWIGKYFDQNVYHGRGARWLCAEGIPQNSKGGRISADLSDEDAARLIENNLIYKSGDAYNLNFPCFGSKTFGDFVSKFECGDPETEKTLSDWIAALRKEFQSFVPKRLDSQINQWVTYFANQIVGFVSEELIRRGVMEKPEEDCPLTNGVFYVEGRYIPNI